MKKRMISKGLVFAVILLFIGVAVQPSIAIVQPEKKNREYIEITIEICGLPRVKRNTIQLPKEQAEELVMYFDFIIEQLDRVETREEAKAILNDVVIEINKYGLLDSLSVEQVQSLVLKTYQNWRFGKLVEKFFKSSKEKNDIDNILCLIASVVEGVNVCGCLRRLLFLEFWVSQIDNLWPDLTWEEIDIIIQKLEFVYFNLFPFRLFSSAVVFNQYPLDFGAKVLQYFSIGLRGIKRGGEWSIMIGFSGLFITMYHKGLFWYFGSTLLVSD
jgi:hypothetical protein